MHKGRIQCWWWIHASVRILKGGQQQGEECTSGVWKEALSMLSCMGRIRRTASVRRSALRHQHACQRFSGALQCRVQIADLSPLRTKVKP